MEQKNCTMDSHPPVHNARCHNARGVLDEAASTQAQNEETKVAAQVIRTGTVGSQ